MRFLSIYIDPDTGRERRHETGAAGETFHRYANVDNVIRFGLKRDVFPAGQYNIYQWPEGSLRCVFIKTAYKKA